jgi:hypothetical protein
MYTSSGHAAVSTGIAKAAEALPAAVRRAIETASGQTGIDFGYLVKKAAIESNLNPQAQAKTSSATGLYQFTQKTWLQMVRDYGDKYGLSDLAQQIDKNCSVQSADARQKILSLRADPTLSACMAGEYAAQNADYLQNRLGQNTDIGETELYLAHFLGPAGAGKFLAALHQNPETNAATLFPDAAKSNKNIFFDKKTGDTKSLKEIYDHFTTKLAQAFPGTDQGTVNTASRDNTSALAANTNTTPSVPSNANRNFSSLDQSFFGLWDTASSSPHIQDKKRQSFSDLSRNESPWERAAKVSDITKPMQQAALMVLIQSDRDIFKDLNS